MELDIREAAALIDVPEDSIYRWIRELGLPSHVVNDQHRFNRVELLEWATAQGIRLSAPLFTPAASQATGLETALRAGGVYYAVPAGTKQEALSAAIHRMPVPEELDRELLLDIILARESLASTGLGDGLAIPHVRNPIVMQIPRPLISLCFLETAVPFNAVDGQPVHTLFTMICPTAKIHLHLLSRLAFALRHPEFAAVLRERAPVAAILAAAGLIDRTTPAPAEGNVP
jgi:PTS system nitrogen regulatory IIA component